MQTSSSVAVLGLGIIGATWARHLESDGVLGAAWNRTPQPTFPKWVATPAAVLAHADTILIVVADPPAVEGLLRALAPKLEPRHLIIQSSTIDPDSSRAFAELVTRHGAAYVEAPFTGSKPAAEQRQTIFYMGGPTEAVARAHAQRSSTSVHRYSVVCCCYGCLWPTGRAALESARLEPPIAPAASAAG